jgi:hypothetical protein
VKLIDLSPCWLTSPAEPSRSGVGLSFLCPTCHSTISVYFVNPIDGFKKTEYPPRSVYYTRSGNTFETLSLAPVIQDYKCRWSGYIIGGAVVQQCRP